MTFFNNESLKEVSKVGLYSGLREKTNPTHFELCFDCMTFNVSLNQQMRHLIQYTNVHK